MTIAPTQRLSERNKAAMAVSPTAEVTDGSFGKEIF